MSAQSWCATALIGRVLSPLNQPNRVGTLSAIHIRKDVRRTTNLFVYQRRTSITTTSTRLLTGPVLALGIAPSSSYAGDVHSLSANAALLQTDYRFRGISQSNEDVAVSGEFDYSYNPLDIYLGVWGSSIEFNGCGATCTDTASTEVNFYGGIAGKLNNSIGLDPGRIFNPRLQWRSNIRYRWSPTRLQYGVLVLRCWRRFVTAKIVEPGSET
jgi:hypothetical protein